MEPNRGLLPTSSRAPELELADVWATFVKSLAIYPATNARVRDHLQRMLAVFGEVVDKQPAEGRGRIALRLSRRELRVGGQTFEMGSHSNLPWLRERLERTLLGGVDFRVPLELDSVTRFSRQLLDHFTRKPLDLNFEQLWTESYPGVEPVALRFEGSFAKTPEGAQAGDEVETLVDEVATAVDVSNTKELEALLLSDVNVMARVGRLRQLYEAEAEVETVELDLLARIIKVLPSEALRDFDVVIRVVTETLDALESRTASGAEPPDSPREATLNRLLLASSHRLFGRDEGPTPRGLVEKVLAAPQVTEAPARSLPKQPIVTDAGITDDLGLLEEELERLPRLDLARAIAEMEVNAEQANAYLTFLAGTDDPKSQSAIHRALADLFSRATSETLAVLRSHLAAHESGEPRIDLFLKSRGHASLARRCGFLQPDGIVEHFPQRFVLFLLSIDYSVPDEARLADAACRRLGPERIREAGPALVADEKMLQWGLPERLCAHSSPEIAPLVRVILNEGSDEHVPGVVKYILTAGRNDNASCLLSVFDGAGSLPRKYLDELLVRTRELGEKAGPTAPASSGPPVPEALSSFISKQLCRFLRETEGDAEATSRRAYAVRFLGFFRSSESRLLLERILKRRKLLVAPCEPRIVRRAAKRALWNY